VDNYFSLESEIQDLFSKNLNMIKAKEVPFYEIIYLIWNTARYTDFNLWKFSDQRSDVFVKYKSTLKESYPGSLYNVNLGAFFININEREYRIKRDIDTRYYEDRNKNFYSVSLDRKLITNLDIPSLRILEESHLESISDEHFLKIVPVFKLKKENIDDIYQFTYQFINEIYKDAQKFSLDAKLKKEKNLKNKLNDIEGDF
jgi:hypothetical protein